MKLLSVTKKAKMSEFCKEASPFLQDYTVIHWKRLEVTQNLFPLSPRNEATTKNRCTNEAGQNWKKKVWTFKSKRQEVPSDWCWPELWYAHKLPAVPCHKSTCRNGSWNTAFIDFSSNIFDYFEKVATIEKVHQVFLERAAPSPEGSQSFPDLDVKQELLIGCAWSMTAELPPGFWACVVCVCAVYCTSEVCTHALTQQALQSQCVCCTLNATWSLGISDTPLNPRMHFQCVTKHGSPTKTETLDWSALSLTKSFILRLFIFRMCSRSRKKKIYKHYWLLLQVTQSVSRPCICNSMGGLQSFSLIKAQMRLCVCLCVGGACTTKTSQHNLPLTHHS